MDLSVVIVNYNVKYFLEQCLHSVQQAMQELNAEVFVVDNNSVDGSVGEIGQKFPWVHMIENRENLGFSKANNQAIRESEGRYVLLLNPDTVVEEDTFKKCIAFMDAHPDAGALGVKMINGKGEFLPESKRALPTPMVSFYKMFGLSSLFPRSRRFGKYHLGHLDKEETDSVEVLAGAFMFLRKETLDKTGLLDESFFMYGEDIDLSYRITKAGYKNYYFPESTIIHYKGESTKKGSLNYVKMFYQAMIIFARKTFYLPPGAHIQHADQPGHLFQSSALRGPPFYQDDLQARIGRDHDLPGVFICIAPLGTVQVQHTGLLPAPVPQPGCSVLHPGLAHLYLLFRRL